MVRASTPLQAATHFETEDERLGVAPTPDERIRLSERAPWDDSTRPHRKRSGPEVNYTDQGSDANCSCWQSVNACANAILAFTVQRQCGAVDRTGRQPRVRPLLAHP
jgi:hypothetical protein